MNKVQVYFGHPLTGAYWLFRLAAVLWSHREFMKCEQHYHLRVCSLRGTTAVDNTQHVCLLDDGSCYGAASVSKAFYDL
jgi:hypothetical protein